MRGLSSEGLSNVNIIFENLFCGGEAGPAGWERVDPSEEWGLGGLGTQRGARGGLVTGALAESSSLVPILHSCFSQSPGIAVELYLSPVPIMYGEGGGEGMIE